MVVQWGSYTLMCPSCEDGPTTSFMDVSRHLTGKYCAVVVDENWRATEDVAQGSGASFMAAVQVAAGAGKRVLITPISDDDSCPERTEE
jgi:hypothetical protein